LLACIVELQSQIAEQQRQIAILTAHTEVFQAEIERLKRSAKRQEAPFSKGTRVTTPQRPGRKPRSGTFCYRTAPSLKGYVES
jgi:Tfp pilus assembly protein PilN